MSETILEMLKALGILAIFSVIAVGARLLQGM